MALYVGEVITIRSRAHDPWCDEELTDLTAEVEFFAPGKNPAKDPADRTVDYGPVAMPYDSECKGYVCYQDTDGWDPGKWTYRVKMTGVDYDNWEYGTVKLNP